MINFGYVHWHYPRVAAPTCGWKFWDGTRDSDVPSGSADIYNIVAGMVQPMNSNNQGVAVVGGVATISGVGMRDAIRLVRLTRAADGSYTMDFGAYARRTLSNSGWDGNALCVLSPTQVLTATCANINQSYVTLYNVNASTLDASFTSEILFDSARVGQASLVTLSSTEALLTFLTYTSGNQALYAVKITVSGNTITKSTTTTLLPASEGPYRFDTVYIPEANRVYVAASSYTGGNNYMKIIPVNCSGAAPVADTTNTYVMNNVAGLDYMSADTRNGKIVVGYGANNSLQVALFELTHNASTGNNDIPVFVDRNVVHSFPSYIGYYYNGVTFIDDKHVLVTFENGTSAYKLTTAVMTYNATNITQLQPHKEIVWGHSAAGGWDNKSGPIDTLRLSNNELLVFYEESDWTLKAKVITSGCDTYVPPA